MNNYPGNLALNIAFVLYLIHYLPQLKHNCNRVKLEQMSLHFHGLLGLSYVCDLGYGVGMGLPWQYRLVSIIGTACIAVQHWQLWSLHATNHLLYRYTLLYALIITLFCIEISITHNQSVFLMMGYISQGAALIFLIPAIIKNRTHRTAQSLNSGYLWMNWLCYGANIIAAFSLDWPTPSKIGTSFGLACLSILIWQNIYTARSIISKQNHLC